MINRLTRLYALLCIGALLVLGCSDKKEEEVKAFVANYCSVLQDTYAKADMKQLVPLATEKELKKIFPLIQALNATNNSMRTEIVDYKIVRTKVADNEATVRTDEKWRYWWVDRTSGLITKQKQEESYQLQYNLIKVDGRWRVDSVQNLKE
ncbi:hypothetical protein [Geomesophilobacter sediminis]|uniref:Uncharacterized protein n=1 Tax=Geomesophilobacter sediminis TaxID=2798584 RepID=A0A8J7J4L3_9BACT|nr:hypothetical protein [Geomesophilobacter sediminis]MBJ6723116.1 hypothetical protein [Geomesophilobacter sediminis]